ncbi:MAG: translational GTPase TypA, partial [Planctomycetota bacterium]|nr:translational GTPase TypA [Planctomycetota bacterium]
PFGEIVCVAGLDGVCIGDTVADRENPRALPRVQVEEPTVSLTLKANTSPLSGRDGRFLTARHIADRLEKEGLRNSSLRISKAPGGDGRVVAGRGELQLAVLVETMRREGYEMEVSRPEVIFREVDGVVHEPYEDVIIDVPSSFIGPVTEELSNRRGQVRNLDVGLDGRARIDIKIPSQGLLGFRSTFLIVTRGQGILHTNLSGYERAGPAVAGRLGGSLVADRPGRATGYALWNLQDRGTLFVAPGTEVYPGMVIGESSMEHDIPCNPSREKHLTNVRAANADDDIHLSRTRTLTLDQALLWINSTEMVEVTPKIFRIRKRSLPSARGR